MPETTVDPREINWQMAAYRAFLNSIPLDRSRDFLVDLVDRLLDEGSLAYVDLGRVAVEQREYWDAH